MIFLADENVSSSIINELRNEGYNVDSIAETCPGISDNEVIQKSNNSEAILITSDKDFGEIVFRKKQISAGVILLRLFGLDSQKKAEILVNTISQHHKKLSGRFTVVRKNQVRITRIL